MQAGRELDALVAEHVMGLKGVIASSYNNPQIFDLEHILEVGRI